MCASTELGFLDGRTFVHSGGFAAAEKVPLVTARRLSSVTNIHDVASLVLLGTI